MPMKGYPSSARSYDLQEEIGSGAYGKVYKASVLTVDWSDFVTNSNKTGAGIYSIRILSEAGFQRNPEGLLELGKPRIEALLLRMTEFKGISEADKEKECAEEAGRICIAVDMSTRRTAETVAVKVLDSDQIAWNEMRRELVTLRSINHKNIVEVYSSFLNHGEEGNEELWIVMPLLQAGSCLSLLKEKYPRGIKDPKLLATILRKVLYALAYLHDDMKVHRDIKAGNILLSEDGEVKIADFGVATNAVGGCGTFVGTPCWMAPEVIERKGAYGTKADIWSFAITAMEIAHGHAPYARYKPLKVLVKTLRDPPPTCDVYPDHKFSKLPSSFHRMLKQCLKKNPSDRPSAKKLISHSFFKNALDCAYLKDHLISKTLERRKGSGEPKKLYRDDKARLSSADERRKASIPVEEFDLDEALPLKKPRLSLDPGNPKAPPTSPATVVAAHTPEARPETRQDTGVRRVGRFEVRTIPKENENTSNAREQKGKVASKKREQNVKRRTNSKVIGRFTVTSDEDVGAKRVWGEI